MPIKENKNSNEEEEKQERFVNLLRLAKDWERDSKVGDKYARIIYKTLKNDGYKVKVIPDINEGLGLPLERKIELAQEEKFKPDALVTIENETIFIDCKGKTKSSSLGYVNVRDYHKYWNGITELNAKMKIYFYIEETSEIWIHDLRDPNKKPHFPIKHFSDGDVYAIPKKELRLYKRLSD